MLRRRHATRINVPVVVFAADEAERDRRIARRRAFGKRLRGDPRDLVVAEHRVERGGQQQRVGDIRGKLKVTPKAAARKMTPIDINSDVR